MIRIKQKELRIKLFKSISFLALFFILSFPAYAAGPTPSCNPSIPGDCPAGLQQLEDVFSNIVSVVVGLGFVAMLVLLTWSGFKFLTSGGEPKALQSARQATTWALMGLFFMVVAWLILQLIASFTGLKVTVFDIKSLCVDPNDPNKWFCVK